MPGLTPNTPIRNLSKIIDRPRLLEKLRTALEHRLTLISAPPGYGKTTLAAQFVLDIACPVAWHTVEERERDLPILHAKSLAALEYIAPGIKSLAYPQGYTPTELVTLIVDHLRENALGDSLYILDDVHQLTGAPTAEAWLRALVTLLPANCHLVLISRSLPALPLAEMIGRRQVLAIGENDLRLTQEEVRDLGSVVLGTEMLEQESRDLATRLEGWPAGTVLALQPLPVDLEHATLSGGEGPEALFDALASTMLAAQPPRIRDFLLVSATLSRLIPEALSAAFNLSDAANWLAEVQIRNLFVVRAPGGMFYHVLFRAFLQRQLRASDPDRFAMLHSQAAAWYQQQDQLDSALDHYLTAGQIQRAADIAERAAYAYFAQGKVETLLMWSSRLRDFDVRIPALLYRCAIVHADRYDYEAAETDLQEVERMLTQHDDIQPTLADIELQRALIKIQRGAYREAARLVSHLAEFPAGPGNVRGRALRILGYAHLRLGDIEAAVRYLEEALPLHRADGDSHALGNVLQDLGVVYARLGYLDDALGCLQEVIALRRSLGSAATIATALNNLGFYYHRSGNYERALQSFNEGLAIAIRFPNRRAESSLRWSLGDLQRDRGLFDEARQLYDKALELLGSSEPALRSEVLISSSILQRWQGKLTDAVSSAQDAAALADTHSLAFERALAHAGVWAARALAGDVEQAMTQLEGAAAELRKQGVQSELAQVLGLCAHVALLKADRVSVRRSLTLALSIEQDHASIQPLAAEVVHTPLLEAFVMKYSSRYISLVEAIRNLQAVQLKTNHHPRLMRATAMSGIYSLRAVVLGRESIERDGQPVPAQGWKATTVKELFFYLLLNGPQSREQLVLAFWPDSTQSEARHNLHSNLYRVRQALGDNVISFQDNVYMVNPDIDLWCDAQELETLVRQARPLPTRDARTEDLWCKAVALYQGPLLPSSYTAWTRVRRETLQELYAEALIGMGHCTRARGDLKGALDTFKHALSVDPYREEIHRAIMSCYADLGEKAQVHTHLQRLQNLLRQELSIEPSSQTMTLAQSLLK